MRHVGGDEISQSTAKRSGIRTQATKELFVGLCARGAGRRSLTLTICNIESIDQGDDRGIDQLLH